jgi:hypothetical protein
MTTTLTTPALGALIAYAEFSATVTVTTTTEATATTLVTAPAFTANGLDAYEIVFAAGGFQTAAFAAALIRLVLYDNGSVYSAGVSTLAQLTNPAAAAFVMPVHAKRRIVPTAGSHAFGFRAYKTTASNGNVYGGGSFQNSHISVRTAA